jgi:hypothetical protein
LNGGPTAIRVVAWAGFLTIVAIRFLIYIIAVLTDHRDAPSLGTLATLFMIAFAVDAVDPRITSASRHSALFGDADQRCEVARRQSVAAPGVQKQQPLIAREAFGVAGFCQPPPASKRRGGNWTSGDVGVEASAR